MITIIKWGDKLKNVFFYETIIGKIAIADNGESITDVHFVKENPYNYSNIKETYLLKKAALEINEYLCKKRKSFDLPLFAEGTEFQRLVWKALMSIPYGETRSYKEIAEAIGNPKACRAVGMANNRNPLMILIPCHRVIGSNGKLVGYGGGLHVKEKLLSIEKTY